ncbi:hypothetical protein DFJ74DRAFT_687620 [Hyaloraphidium curvatum]|nr:hypothetical protein DFJ74DRAFT_687620 [Hyaloraphidium curvatum]
MEGHSPGPPPGGGGPSGVKYFGPDDDKTCSTCGNAGHASYYSPYCPQTRSIKARGRDHGDEETGVFKYRDFVWRCNFQKFCKSTPVAQVLRNMMVATSQARFEATRFLQLFLSRTVGSDLIRHPLKDSCLTNLFKAFYAPSADSYATPRRYLAAFHPSAPAIFAEHFLPRHTAASWPGDSNACRNLSVIIVHNVTSSLRRQYAAAWKRHVLYNIGAWTVGWLKDMLAVELRGVWEEMPAWQRTKLAWCIYTYVTLGETDGMDISKRNKAAKKKKRKASEMEDDNEYDNEPAELKPFELPELRTRTWPNGCFEAALLYIEEVRHRLGPTDRGKKTSGGIIVGKPNDAYLWLSNHLNWLRFLAGLRNREDDEHRKFALCPLFNWKRAFFTVDTTLLFSILDHVRAPVLAEKGAPRSLPETAGAFTTDKAARDAWNEHLFRLSPNMHRKERAKVPSNGRPKPASRVRKWDYSYSFATDCEGVSVLCAKRYRAKTKKEREEAEKQRDEMDEEVRRSGSEPGLKL